MPPPGHDGRPQHAHYVRAERAGRNWVGPDTPYSRSQSYSEVPLVSGNLLPADGSRRLERGDGRAASGSSPTRERATVMTRDTYRGRFEQGKLSSYFSLRGNRVVEIKKYNLYPRQSCLPLLLARWSSVTRDT